MTETIEQEQQTEAVNGDDGSTGGKPGKPQKRRRKPAAKPVKTAAATKPARRERTPREPKEPLVIQRMIAGNADASMRQEWEDMLTPEGILLRTEEEARSYLRKSGVAGTYRTARYGKPVTVAVESVPKVRLT